MRNIENVPYLQPHKSEAICYIASKLLIITMNLSFMLSSFPYYAFFIAVFFPYFLG